MTIKNNNLIGVVGDPHMKESLSYADYISDRRVAEKKEILDFIIESFKDCQHVVFMGDIFHSKNNSSETCREVVEFIEKFGDKEIYIISGNHEKKGDGKTAIDFLGEIKRKNWHIFTRPSSISFIWKGQSVGASTIPKDAFKIDFLPYMLNSELEVETHEEATKHIMKHLDGGDILFAHHAITGTSWGGIKTEMFKEVVLPREKLEKKYRLVVGGHIHDPQQSGNTLITGSLFTSTVGETEKFIYKIKNDLTIDKIRLPGRGIWKLENPTPIELTNYSKESIIKVILTDKKIDAEEIQKTADGIGFEAFLLIEDYPSSRKKAHIEEGAFDFSVEALLKLYAKEKGVDHSKLLKGLELISINE